ncbi:peptidase C39 family protein, partial [Streptomyces sp. SID6013]|nr:peptidase C39 family protein [Streptomyces sp. SID6013]
MQRRTRPTRTPGGLPPMSRVEQPSRRTLLAAAVAAAAVAGGAIPATAQA